MANCNPFWYYRVKYTCCRVKSWPVVTRPSEYSTRACTNRKKWTSSWALAAGAAEKSTTAVISSGTAVPRVHLCYRTAAARNTCRPEYSPLVCTNITARPPPQAPEAAAALTPVISITALLKLPTGKLYWLMSSRVKRRFCRNLGDRFFISNDELIHQYLFPMSLQQRFTQ